LGKGTADIITTTNVQISTRSSFHDKIHEESVAAQNKHQIELKSQLRKAQKKVKEESS
jgi:hypothetical protein